LIGERFMPPLDLSQFAALQENWAVIRQLERLKVDHFEGVENAQVLNAQINNAKKASHTIKP